MGIVRAAELFKSCQILGIDTENVKVVEDPKLQDGFDSIWEPDAVAHVVSDIVDQWKIDSIITFDDRGVSGHPNHISCYEAVGGLLRRTGPVAEGISKIGFSKALTLRTLS